MVFNQARRRPGKSLLVGVPGGVPSETARKHKDKHEEAHRKGVKDNHKKQIAIFFGGETGTCESLAQTLSQKGSERGLEFNIQSLDVATENLPADRASVIITSSYEGKPPGNAKKFVTWLEQLSKTPNKLKDIKYAVYGVGNSDWAATYHRIPILVDDLVAKLGGERIVQAGFSNVKEDLIGPWEDWSDELIAKLSGSQTAPDNNIGVEVTVQSSDLAQRLGGREMNIGQRCAMPGDEKDRQKCSIDSLPS